MPFGDVFFSVHFVIIICIIVKKKPRTPISLRQPIFLPKEGKKAAKGPI